MVTKMNEFDQCATCAHYLYDNYADEYYCDVDIDQDEYSAMASGKRYECPYYRYYNEYDTVKKQN